MDQITARTLRAVEWKPVYQYGGTGDHLSFTTYACGALPGLTITKERRGRRLRTIYQFEGRKTNSPTQAVRFWNEAARAAKQDQRPAPGSAEQVRLARRAAGL